MDQKRNINIPFQYLQNVDMLEFCTKIGFEMVLDGHKKEALKFISDVFQLSNAPFISACINQFFLRVIDTSEQDIYALFIMNYKKIFGEECEIVKIKNSPKHIPDFWVKVHSTLIPVECKLSNFDKKALKQLLRYMEFYKCFYGIAVASKFTCKLPNSIIPVTVDQLKNHFGALAVPLEHFINR